LRFEQGMAVLTLNHPPINALSSSVRNAICQALQTLAVETTLRALVITGAGRGFSAGADNGDLSEAYQEPTLPQLIEALESFRVPVIAALHGPVPGGGLELALGAHYRIADAAAKLGLPEIALGLIPGAGGTQRLPRLVGLEAALEMISTGESISAQRALEFGLIDELASDELLSAALNLASALSKADRAVRLVRMLPAPTDTAGTLVAARARLQLRREPLPAMSRVIESLQACITYSFEEGLKAERHAFLGLRDSPESAALRYAFAAERNATRPPAALAGLTSRRVQNAAVVGAGTMAGYRAGARASLNAPKGLPRQ
jgi:3-hydroxyacyl-CoA dehydrogenase